LRRASIEHVAKPKKCKVCRGEFAPRTPMQVVCGITCAKTVAAKVREKKAADVAKTERKADRAKREALKTRNDHVRDAQVAFNAFIRARDRAAGYACISSGRPLDWSGNAVDAGHYRSVGSAPHLRFNEDNCHAQSKHDNQYKAGNAVDYRIGLIARIGLERVEALEADQTPRKWSIAELVEIKATYRKKLRDLQAKNSINSFQKA
jgi:hypothetical protein